MLGQDPSAAIWTPQFQTTLTKFIQELFTTQPPSFLPVLRAEEVQVDKKLILRDLVQLTKEPNFRPFGGTGNPAFANSWTHFNTATDQAAGFWRDPFGWVHLRGVAKSGTVGLPLANLPPGFRPPQRERFVVISNDAVGRVDVEPDGDIVPLSPSNNIYVSLSGIQFRTS